MYGWHWTKYLFIFLLQSTTRVADLPQELASICLKVWQNDAFLPILCSKIVADAQIKMTVLLVEEISLFEICNAYGTKRFHEFALALVGNRSQYIKFDVMCQKLWSEINNMFPFMHEHCSGEDQLYTYM